MTRLMLRIGQVLLVVLVTILLIRAFDSRSQMPLEVEHKVSLTSDYQASRDQDLSWSDYLTLEDRLEQELRDKLATRQNDASSLNRHAAGGVFNPLEFEQNWNRSYVMTPDQAIGGAVLMHGLSDSPYSVRATAQIFKKNGYQTYVPRHPGHGFNVGSLDSRDREDWFAVLKMTVREATASLGPGQPFVIGGYSTGAALAIRYALECEELGLPCPDGILLISPAIAVTPFAALAHVNKTLSWLPWFAQFKWESIAPEIDPYKFTSFPKNPGWDSAQLSSTITSNMSGAELPPILLFQSVVDSTVSTQAIADFMIAIQPNQHEVVIYEMNRHERMAELIRDWTATEFFSELGPQDIDVTILTNENSQTSQVSTYHLAPGSTTYEITDTALRWPSQTYSLSHIALPFPPEDAFYGQQGQAIGLAQPRGENGMIRLPPKYFQRLRHNPFFSYQEQRIETWLAGISNR